MVAQSHANPQSPSVDDCPSAATHHQPAPAPELLQSSPVQLPHHPSEPQSYKRALKRWSVASRVINRLGMSYGAVMGTGSEGVCEHLLTMNAALRLVVVSWASHRQLSPWKLRGLNLGHRFPERMRYVDYMSGTEDPAVDEGALEFLLIDGSWGQETSEAEILRWTSKVGSGGYLLGFVNDPGGLLAVTKTIGKLVSDFEILHYSVWKMRI
jgi:hypothetical protein